MRPLTCLGTALAMTLSGCAVGPDYTRQNLVLPAAFVGGERGAPAPDDSADRWWDRFGDPALAPLVREALQGNLQIEQSAVRLAQARAGVRYARAALLPGGAVGGTAAVGHVSVETPLGKVLNATPGFDRDGELYELNAAASWELDLFGGLSRARESADANADAAAADVQAVRLAVAAQTAAAYIGLRALQARLDLTQQRIAHQVALRGLVAQLVEEGLAPLVSLEQTDVGLTQMRALELPLRAAVEATRNALDLLLGQPAGHTRQRFSEAGPVPQAPAIGGIETPAELLRRRPDLIAAERRVAAAHARIGQAMAEYYPKVSLGALVGSASTTGGAFLGNSAAQAQGVLGLRWRLFDFGRVDAGIAAARGQSAEALVVYKLVALRATEEVESALSELSLRRQQSRWLDEGALHAARSRDTAAGSLAAGLSNRLDLLRSEDVLLQLRDAKVQADAAAGLAAVAAYRALGGGWRPDDGTAPWLPTPTTATVRGPASST